MKKIVLVFILITSYAFSQSVNDYQYVIVPVKFDFLKKEDQYGLNNLTKLLLQKYGFKAFLSTEEIPSDLENNRCNFLYADVIENNGMMMTKVKLTLKDCKEKVLFETQFGGSREKEYAVAYNQALREAGKSFDKLNYKYNGKSVVTSEIGAVQTNVIRSLLGKEAALDGTTLNSSQEFYFAQPNTNGFQIVNSEPKIIMLLFNTSQKNVFIGVKGSTNGVVISKNGQWFFEYYENGKLVSELLKLKF